MGCVSPYASVNLPARQMAKVELRVLNLELLGVMPMENKREREQVVLRRWLESLNLQGVGISLEAYTVKKRRC